MNDLTVKNVNLFGDTVMAAQDNEGRVWAGVKWICDGLGLSEGQSKNERKKLQEDLVLSEGTKFHPLGRGNANKEVLCLRHDFVPLWIAKITVTPAMKENNPSLVDKLVQYQLKAKDVLAEAFLPKKEKQDKPKKKNLSSANMLVKTVSGIFKDAGVDPLYIAAEAKRLYKEQADIDIMIPLVTDKETMPKLYDCTEIAKELGICSNSGKPHNQAVSAIIKKLDVPDSEIVTTAFSRNGHDDVTTQYKPSVFEDVKRWLEENGYPTKIPYVDSKGNQKTCTVVYAEVA